jgi:RluA family pseudouridine synthase
MNRWRVGEETAGTRLDKYLASTERLGSRRRAIDALTRRKVFVNEREAARGDAGVLLRAGDEVRLWMDRPGTSRRLRSIGERRDLAIVYEDEAVIVLDKPPGVLSVPLPRRSDARSVYEDLRAHLKQQAKHRVFVVHRIDRDTSGLVLFAKTARAHEHLKSQFKRHEAGRVYLALVYGQVSPSSGTWRDRLVWDDAALVQKETHPRDPAGKEATSRYRLVEQFENSALIEVSLVTGRRNQIRLQARLHGHMLVGERRYTFGPDTLRTIAFPRQALHAHRLTFRHPANEREMHFESPLPTDMAELVRTLKGKIRK